MIANHLVNNLVDYVYGVETGLDSNGRKNRGGHQMEDLVESYIVKEGDMVLDQFAGGGTTLVEAKLLNRNIIGVDVNDVALARCKEKTDFEHEGANGKVCIEKGDARNLAFKQDGSIDLICTHPPYADIIKYSEETNLDIPTAKPRDTGKPIALSTIFC